MPALNESDRHLVNVEGKKKNAKMGLEKAFFRSLVFDNISKSERINRLGPWKLYF